MHFFLRRVVVDLESIPAQGGRVHQSVAHLHNLLDGGKKQETGKPRESPHEQGNNM